MEKWKDVVGYEGLYLVSNQGRVKRTATILNISASGSGRTKGHTRTRTEKILKGFLNNKGYWVVDLYNGGRHTRKHQFIHRLVYNAFSGLKKGVEIDHIDRNTENNNIENLRQCTHLENCQNYGENKRNTSGRKNVYKDKRRGTYFYDKMINGIKYCGFGFSCVELAHNALQNELIKAGL